ncbi:MAG: peptidoglycan DL-endopeptidase CwlO [Actinomycetota bacterium]|jgi:cell wall-associated NlpC family hydrolase|nr:peptidoglycan DL-endopeptidase CwlO [Actinomycetota bacterium]
MKQRFARLTLAGACIAILAGALLPSAASGSTITDKKAQAQQLKAEIDANGEKISILAEKYNGAQIALDAVTRSISGIKSRLVVAQADTERTRVIVARRVAALYMSAGSQSPIGWMDASSVSDAGSRSMYGAVTADRDRLSLEELAASRADLRAKNSELENAKQRAQSQLDAIAASKQEVEAANVKQADLLAQVNGEVATLIAQEEARQAAAEKAASDAEAARLHLLATSTTTTTSVPPPVTNDPVTTNAPAVTSGTPSVVPGNTSVPDVPAPSAGAAAAVAYAKAQLGKPYQYAGVGPDSYDCSGLTMMAWAQGGVSMPHYSGAQGDMFPRVPDDALQPGDLVIYYPDHHHVGIYVGDGMTISATQTGDFIKLQPVFRSGYQFAVRPG